VRQKRHNARGSLGLVGLLLDGCQQNRHDVSAALNVLDVVATIRRRLLRANSQQPAVWHRLSRDSCAVLSRLSFSDQSTVTAAAAAAAAAAAGWCDARGTRSEVPIWAPAHHHHRVARP